MRRVLLFLSLSLHWVLLAQEVTISNVVLDELGNLHLDYDSESEFYYLLVRGNTVENILFAVDVELGEAGPRQLVDLETDLDGAFYRILKIPVSQPFDTDQDGIDDITELGYETFLDPLDDDDALRDFDRDGVNNVDEIRLGRNPTAFDGVQIFSPMSGRTFNAPANILITVESGPDIISVDFYQGDSLIGTDTESPYVFDWLDVPSGDYSLTVVGHTGGGSTFTSDPVALSVSFPPAEFLASKDLTNEGTVTVSGTVQPNATVTITGGLEVVHASSGESGNVQLEVPLIPNRLNRLFAVVRDSSGRDEAPVPIQVIQDSEPPHLFIDFPADGTEVTTASVTIAGRVGDMLSGHEGLNVDVEEGAAEVIVGIGQNGTFERQTVPLAEGLNFIDAVATDAAGNSTSTRISLKRTLTNGPRMMVISGDGQVGSVQTPLSAPFIVRVLTEENSPVPNKLVTFEVLRSDGLLKTTSSSSEKGGLSLQVYTDPQGVARAYLTLGTDAGCGNNRVQVTSRDVTGTVYFCASAMPGPARQINIGSGNRLKVEAGGMAQEPLRVWVSDSCNGVAGIPVTFNVTRGDGLVNGSSSTVADTAVTGHAEVFLQLGPDPGNNIISADFPGNPGQPAVFVIEGVGRDITQPTSWDGIVLDNSRQPIGGALATLEVEGIESWSSYTNDEGRFSMVNIPSGPGRLIVNGRTATKRGGLTVPEGSFPSLYFEIMAIANAENSLPSPVLLPLLNPANERFYDGTEDVVLEVEEMAGLKMIVAAGSMTRPDGTKPSPDDPEWISLNQVHHDDVPMPMPDGAAPPFAWTLQPLGSHFDPPVRIEYPNMSSLQPGAVAYFLSYNHDTERFEIVASGAVSKDGSTIVTDPGVGLSIAGWGCNCPPYAVSADCTGDGTQVRDDDEDPPETGTRTKSESKEDPGTNPGDCTTYCLDNGQITVSNMSYTPKIVCSGRNIEFSSPLMTDSGGSEEEACRQEDGSIVRTTHQIAPAGVTYWNEVFYNNSSIRKLQAGSNATVYASKPGIYSCQFTGMVDRDCPPEPGVSPKYTAMAIGVQSVSAGDLTSTTDSIGDSSTLYVCQGVSGEKLTFTAASTFGNTWPVGEPIWLNADTDDGTGGPVARMPVDSLSTDKNGTIVTVWCGNSEKSMKVVVIGTGSVSGEGVVSTTEFPGDDETIYVCQGMPGETITLGATPSVGDKWPAGEPTWIGAAGNGDTATFPIDTVSDTPTGTLVSANCGASQKSIGVVVVGVDSVEAKDVVSKTDNPGDMETLRVCREAEGTTITLTANPTPDANWPEPPMWENATPQGDGTTATFPIDTVSEDSEGTVVKVRCGESVKAIRIVVVVIEKVEWIAKDAPLDANPNPGGGLRIFAEKPTPASEVQDKVFVRATITPAIDNADVYFRLKDVDDPSSNHVDLDDESDIWDNLGGFGSVDWGPHKTNAAGQAMAEVTVTRQPGDNYRVIAECWPESEWISGTTAVQDDGTRARILSGNKRIVPDRYLTPLLTVWRTLHFEEDSMGPIDPVENSFRGNIIRIESGKGSSTSLLGVDQPINGDTDGSFRDHLVDGRYHNGRMTLGSPEELVVNDISGTFGNPAIASSAKQMAIVPLSFSAEDDDFAGNSTFAGTVLEIEQSGSKFQGNEKHVLTLNITTQSDPVIDWPDFVGGEISIAGGDPVEIIEVDPIQSKVTVVTVSIPVILVDDDQTTLPYNMDYSGFVSEVFEEAYLKVVLDGGGDPANNKYNLDPLINWPVATEEDPSTESDSDNLDELLDISGALESHANRSDDFWIAYVLWGFQAGTTEDLDPDKETDDTYVGVVPKIGGRGTFIPLEHTLDGCAPDKEFPLTYVEETVCHEVGHEFGLEHSSMMMHPSSAGNKSFNPADLRYIRSEKESPGLRKGNK
jgi:hypothetical protein